MLILFSSNAQLHTVTLSILGIKREDSPHFYPFSSRLHQAGIDLVKGLKSAK